VERLRELLLSASLEEGEGGAAAPEGNRGSGNSISMSISISNSDNNNNNNNNEDVSDSSVEGAIRAAAAMQVKEWKEAGQPTPGENVCAYTIYLCVCECVWMCLSVCVCLYVRALQSSNGCSEWTLLLISHIASP
jgi:hypothetical protein